MNHFLDRWPTKKNPSPSLLLTVSTNTVPTPTPRKSTCKQKALPHKTENAIYIFNENFPTGQNELINHDNKQNDTDTIEPGLGEIYPDKSITANE